MLEKIKYYLPFELAGIRTVSFIPIILSTFNVISIPVYLQIFLSTIIIGSDIIDGKISRKTFPPKTQLAFRLTDTIIDKTGITSCLLGLLTTNKIPIPYFTLLAIYHTLLLGGGAFFLKMQNKKKEKNVQGLFISRLFTALVGISILLCNNINMLNSFGMILTIGMALLGTASLTTQFLDKYHQFQNTRSCDKPELKQYATSMQYIRLLERRITTAYRLCKGKANTKNENENLSLQDIIKGFQDIDSVLSKQIKEIKRENNIILLQVPSILFEPPYEEKDILNYIDSHALIEKTLDNLHNQLERIKNTIIKPTANQIAHKLSKKKKDTI